MTVSAAAVACALAVFPQLGVGARLSLLQVRAQAAEVIRTGSCAESSGGTSYFLGNANIELGITPGVILVQIVPSRQVGTPPDRALE